MHELSIAMSIVDVAVEEALRRHMRPVAVHVRVGEVSGVVPDALLSAFDLAREGTPLSGCRLVVEKVPVIIHCDICQADKPAESVQAIRCCDCGAPAARIVSGRELELAALEVDE